MLTIFLFFYLDFFRFEQLTQEYDVKFFTAFFFFFYWFFSPLPHLTLYSTSHVENITFLVGMGKLLLSYAITKF